ncbi:putativ membrane protein [Caldisalinibacter kiritimatiensis]|uniref:Putativ membrane protein n=1 Tax=Caldisalinibacter kiritimatiensis TaxID=1304284 RepID=R1CE73_9FIRM|nr:ABC transporter permease subunit [Caldisalinibacter kiritimatiensis]EOD00590.1 putativ membrane protein [Caldisalinibacter kiritimatiensis]
MFKLIENEGIKLLYKRRLLVISVLLLLFIVLYAYGQKYISDKTEAEIINRLGEIESDDWTKIVKQQILDLNTKLQSPYTLESRKASIKVKIERLQYYINNNINPLVPGSARFTKSFMEDSIPLFLPMLIIILASDIVSSEFSDGTIKILLTKPVPRWKILLSKYISLLIITTFVIILTGIYSVIISSLFFGFNGWNEPIVTGFKVINGKLDASQVQNIEYWQYIILLYSLAWYVSIVIGTLTFMVSVLVRSTPVAIGIMVSTLIAGNFMNFLFKGWDVLKYLFTTNIELSNFLSGRIMAVDNITLSFSLLILFIWGAFALIISFIVFMKQDVLV